MLFDLASLGLYVELMLELRPIGVQVGRTARTGAEIQLMVKTAITDGTMAFGTEVEMMLNLCPRFLQRLRLLCMPLATIDLLSCLCRASPEPA